MNLSIPFNDTSRTTRHFKSEIDTALRDVTKKGVWIKGHYNKLFAESFSEFIGTRFCVPLANGTDALELAIKAIKIISPGRNEVITVANAGGYTSTACHLAGAIPVYVDVVPKTLLIDIDEAISAITSRTMAIVVTHLYGGAVDVPKLKEKIQHSSNPDILIIEDCAQAHGAIVNQQRVGSLGDIGTFSFYPTKNLGAIGDAGAITTSSEALRSLIQSLSQYGWESKYKIKTFGGRNSRMDEVQAAVLYTLLPHLDDLNKKRQLVRASYLAALPESIELLNYDNCDHVAHLTIARTDFRDELKNYLLSHQIGSDIHYPILDCDQLAWKGKKIKIASKNDLKYSRQSLKKIISLPCFPFMKKKEIKYFINTLEKFQKSPA